MTSTVITTLFKYYEDVPFREQAKALLTAKPNRLVMGIATRAWTLILKRGIIFAWGQMDLKTKQLYLLNSAIWAEQVDL